MTILECILTTIIWIAYGVFAAFQEKDSTNNLVLEKYIVFIILSPVVFICKALYGAFKEYY